MKFKEFSFLIERSVNSVIRKIFRDGQGVSGIDRPELEARMQEFSSASLKIETLANDELMLGIFCVKTKAAK
jgi:hypothetical protein